MAKWGRGGAANYPPVQFEKWVAEGKAIRGSEGDYLPDFTERVRAGMDILDRVAPGWQLELDLEHLDLESEDQCVLGQTWSHYSRARGLVAAAVPLDSHWVMTPGVLELQPATSTFHAMLDGIFSFASGNHADQMAFAASIGCALNEEDFILLNAWVKQLVEAESDRRGHQTHEMWVETGDRIVHMYWEHLTKTWIREIREATANGRWTPRPLAVRGCHVLVAP